jgi:carbonic anhydrase
VKLLEKIWHKFPLKENKALSIDLSGADIKSIMPSNKDYYKFMGSLETLTLACVTLGELHPRRRRA